MDNPAKRKRRRRRNPENPRRKKYAVYARPTRRRNPENPRRRRRRNPDNPRRTGRARGFLGLDFAGVGKDLLPMAVGAVAGQMASKKLDADDTTGGASQPWTWKNYLLCILGSYLSGVVLGMLRPKSGMYLRRQAVNGGLLLVVYNLVVKELAAKSTTVMGLLGEAGAAGGDAWRYMKPGDVWQGQDGKQYALGSDNKWRNVAYLGAASVGDIVDAERYGDMVDAERYGQPEETDITPGVVPPMTDPYYRQYMPFM